MNDREIAYSGEVWTDGRGYATVALPRRGGRVRRGCGYELRPDAPGVRAVLAAEFLDGRFTIETDEPHVKVSWSVTACRSHANEEGER